MDDGDQLLPRIISVTQHAELASTAELSLAVLAVSVGNMRNGASHECGVELEPWNAVRSVYVSGRELFSSPGGGDKLIESVKWLPTTPYILADSIALTNFTPSIA